MIKTGSVALQSDDIGHVLIQVYGIVGGIGGDISREDTSTDAKGKAVRSTMVLRVPVEDFDTTLLQLSKLGTLVNRVSNAKDVTTEVADIDSRVRSAQRSIVTLRQLFDRANKLSDIIRLESELSQRESDLESLEAQQRSLDDRTTMSTITLTMELPPVAPTPKPVPRHDDKAGGFVSGIHQGWNALTETVRAVGHGLGVVLPLGTLALLLAALVYWLVRRFAPHGPTAATRRTRRGLTPWIAGKCSATRRSGPDVSRNSRGGRRQASREWTSSTRRVKHVGVGVGQHAVAEVEDVAGGDPARVDDRTGGALDRLPRCEDQRRVEVALDRLAGLDPADGRVERDPPVDAHHLDAGRAHVTEQLTRRDPEVDPRHVEVGDRGEHLPGVRQHVLPVVRGRQPSGPRVEQLHR